GLPRREPLGRDHRDDRRPGADRARRARFVARLWRRRRNPRAADARDRLDDGLRRFRDGRHAAFHRLAGDPAMLAVRRLAALPLAAFATPALAHGTHEGPIGWTLSPDLLIPLGLALLIYVVGWTRL